VLQVTDLTTNLFNERGGIVKTNIAVCIKQGDSFLQILESNSLTFSCRRLAFSGPSRKR
jgi:hypothetical protein